MQRDENNQNTRRKRHRQHEIGQSLVFEQRLDLSGDFRHSVRRRTGGGQKQLNSNGKTLRKIEKKVQINFFDKNEPRPVVAVRFFVEIFSEIEKRCRKRGVESH